MPKTRTSRAPQPTSDQQDERVFKALANGHRRAIMDLLRRAPQTTGAICEHLEPLDRCTAMLHLRALEDADLVIAKKKGRSRWNYLNVEPIQRVYRRWIKRYAEPAADLLAELKRQIEAE